MNSELFYPYDYTFNNPYSFSADGTSPNSNFAVGANGNVLLGAGGGSDYQLAIYVKSVAITPTGSVFLNPQGIVNAANNVPFTVAVFTGRSSDFVWQRVHHADAHHPGSSVSEHAGRRLRDRQLLGRNGNPATAPAPIYL